MNLISNLCLKKISPSLGVNPLNLGRYLKNHILTNFHKKFNYLDEYYGKIQTREHEINIDPGPRKRFKWLFIY